MKHMYMLSMKLTEEIVAFYVIWAFFLGLLYYD